MRVFRGPLRSSNFWLLLACDIVSIGGNAVALVAVPFAVLAVGGSPSDVGYVATAALVPTIVFLLLGGVVADRLPRHLVMVAADGLQAAAQAAAAVLVLTGTARVWELLALAAARGTGFGFYFPAEAGLLPQTVPPQQRAQANAIDRVGRNGAQIGGAALGGAVVAALGPGWGLAVDAASFAIAMLLRVGMRFPAHPPAQGPGMLRELHEGWREFRSRRWLWAIVMQFSCVVAVTTAALTVLGPIVAVAHLGGASSWGFILAAYAAGAVIGGAAMIRLRPARLLLAATVSVLVFSVLLFALAVPLTVPLLALAALLAGACLQVFGINWATAMQQEIPLTALSRVSAYDALGSYALAPVGTVIAGPLAGLLGTAAVLDTGGALIVVLTAAVLLVPEVRHLRRRAAAGPAATATGANQAP